MIHSFIFSEGRLVGRDLEIEALRLVRADKGLLLWVDLDHPTDEEIKQILEDTFTFHTLAIEDCVTPSSLPKIEDYEDYLFAVAHAVDFTRTDGFHTTELNLFLGKEFLVTFHRSPLRSVQSTIERCAKSPGAVARSSDRLAHLILDLLVDNFQPVIQQIRDRLGEIEDDVLTEEGDLTPRLLALRSQINTLRATLRPQRDVVARLAHGESKILRPPVMPYYRDLRDGLVRLDETAAAFSDQLLVCFDLYLNKSAFQANEGIKVLTALTAITLPIIVVGTWYGMNFEHMPELHTAWGYPVLSTLTAISTLAMYLWCKRKKWL